MLFLLLVSTLNLAFNIQSVKAETGTIYIRADGSIDPPDAPIITKDKITYTLTDNITSNGIVVKRSNIILNGAGYTLKGPGWVTTIGILLRNINNITIENINIQSFGYGIVLDCSSNNVISGNSITNNKYAGIQLDYSSNNVISGNSITNNELDGICLSCSSNNVISGNSVANNEYGIYLDGIYLYASSNNVISGNSITNNKYAGIYLNYSPNNVISGNSITNNKYGVILDGSSGNTIYHNNLINNTKQVQPHFLYPVNSWDGGYPSGGNYWSDYTGVDEFSGPYQNETGSDGIGDTPYIIDAYNRDRYPLMNPWPPTPVYVKGVDVSHWQGSIIWPEVYSAGYRFAFVKASEGVGWVDPNFEANMKGGRNAGLFMGAYHFARPDLGNNPKDEAEYFISVASEYLCEGFLRPALDLETGSALGKDALSNWVRIWMETVKNETGIEPIIYVNSYYANNYLDASLAKYDLWIADWTYDPSASPNTGIWETWSFWQYSDKGSVPGITGNVDLNLFNGNMQRLYNAFAISNLKVLNVTWEDKTYPITILSNSTVTHLVFNQPQAQISFNVTGPHGSKGYCNITIPKHLLKGPWTFTFEGSVLDIETKETENETHSFIIFTYIHASTFRVIIQGTWAIPEFSSTTILLTFIISTLTATILLRKREKQKVALNCKKYQHSSASAF